VKTEKDLHPWEEKMAAPNGFASASKLILSFVPRYMDFDLPKASI
jgi:hypothetical protein